MPIGTPKLGSVVATGPGQRQETAVSRLREFSAHVPLDTDLWNTLGMLLVQSHQTSEALEAFAKVLDLDQNKEGVSANTWSVALQHRNALLRQCGREQEAAADNLSFRHLPTRPADLPNNLIDLSCFYNAALNEAIPPDRSPDICLASLPTGKQRFLETDYDLRGLILLSGGYLRKLSCIWPKEVHGMRVDQVCSKLHFLHAARWNARVGAKIGSYLVHFSNGSSAEVPIIMGRDVRGFYPVSEHGRNTFEARVAWSGLSPFLQNPERLFETVWENPFPSDEIRTIDFVSAMTEASPFLVAITFEQNSAQSKVAGLHGEK